MNHEGLEIEGLWAEEAERRLASVLETMISLISPGIDGTLRI